VPPLIVGASVEDVVVGDDVVGDDVVGVVVGDVVVGDVVGDDVVGDDVVGDVVGDVTMHGSFPAQSMVVCPVIGVREYFMYKFSKSGLLHAVF